MEDAPCQPAEVHCAKQDLEARISDTVLKNIVGMMPVYVVPSSRATLKRFKCSVLWLCEVFSVLSCSVEFLSPNTCSIIC